MAKIMGQRPGSYQPGPTAQVIGVEKEILSRRNHIISHLRPLSDPVGGAPTGAEKIKERVWPGEARGSRARTSAFSETGRFAGF